MSKNGWRSFKITKLDTLITKTEYDNIISLLEKLDIELKVLMEHISKDIDKILELECLTSAGNFRDYILKEYGKPYTEWENIDGYKSKYYRILIEQARNNIISLQDHITINNVCEKYDYNVYDENIAKELEELGVSYTHGMLRNICRAKKTPVLNTDIKSILNFTAEDNQLSITHYDNKNDIITFKVRIFSEWVTISSKLPTIMRYVNAKFARPVIQRDKITGELYVRVSYDIPVMSVITSKTDKSGVLSTDIGKVKIFSSVITFKDGSYSAELAPSQELEQLNTKLSILDKEKKSLQSKIYRNECLLNGKNNPYLAKHVADQYRERDYISSKIISVKEHMSWLIARDIIFHAYYHGVDTLKIENLKWLDSKAGKWAFSDIRDKLVEIAELYGVTVLLVDARNTSKTNPFTKEPVVPRRDRTVNISGDSMDRDYCAALEIGTRTGTGIKKSRIVDRNKKKSHGMVKGRTRDKHHSTPKRPRVLRRKSCLKLMVKRGVCFSDFNNTSGVSVAVASSGIVSNNALCLPVFTGFNDNNKIL